MIVALSAFAAALLPCGWSLLLALAVYGPASGCTLAVAEGLLVEAEPEARPRRKPMRRYPIGRRW